MILRLAAQAVTAPGSDAALMHNESVTPHVPQRPASGAGRKAFRALRHRNYRLFFFGQLISLIGTWMQTTALPLLIVNQIAPDKPELWLGLVGFLPLLPLVPLSLVAGSLADRFPKRTILVLTQTTLMLQAFALAALTLTGAIQMWHVLLLTFVAGAASALDVPARQAFVIEMIDDRADLDSGIALNSATFNLGRAIGPVLGGLLVAVLGFGAAFFANGVTFIAVIISLLLMKLPPHTQPVKPPKMHHHLIEGLRYVWRHDTLTILMSLVAVSAFLSMPFMTLMPVFVQSKTLPDGTFVPVGPLAASAKPVSDWVCGRLSCQDQNAVPYGLLMGAFGLGALFGALLVGVYSDRGRGRLLTIGNLFFPLFLLIFAASQAWWLSLFTLIAVGVVFILQNALTNTLVQLASPDQLRGRVMSIYSILFQGMQGAGRMQGGFTATFIGAPLAVGVGALMSLAYGVFVAVRWPKIRQLK
jgi:MFS family permease